MFKLKQISLQNLHLKKTPFFLSSYNSDLEYPFTGDLQVNSQGYNVSYDRAVSKVSDSYGPQCRARDFTSSTGGLISTSCEE